MDIIKTPRISFLFSLLVVLGLLGCTDTSEPPEKAPEVAVEIQTRQEPAIPDELVVTVNGTPIMSRDYERRVLRLIRSMEAKRGESLSEAGIAELRFNTMETLINRELLHQEARRFNITATEEEVEAKFKLEMMKFPNPKIFYEELEKRGITEEELRVESRQSIEIDKFITTQVLTPEAMKVSEEEIRRMYEAIKKNTSGKSPNYEAVRAQVINILRKEKKKEVMADFVIPLRQESEVIFFDEFEGSEGTEAGGSTL